MAHARRNSKDTKDPKDSAAPLNTDYDNIIADKIDLLYEKRKAIREAALGALSKTLSIRYCGGAVEKRQETLVEALERVLKDQQPEPVLLTLRTISLTAITLPTGHSALFFKLHETLKKIIISETQPPNTKIEAAHALAMSCFMSSLFDVDHEMSTTAEVLRFFQDQLFPEKQTVDSVLANSILQGWTLLISTLPASVVHDEYFSNYFDKVRDFMAAYFDINLRVTAAKTIAVLLELEKDYQKTDDAQEADTDVEDILDKILAIYDDKGQFNKSLELKRQRGALKSLLSFIENGSSPEETIIIRKMPLVLNTWMQLFRMDAFKQHLGEGFMTHLEENRNLMYLFDYYVDINAPIVPSMSKKERRLSLSELSKAATKERFGLRAIREADIGYATE